MNKPATAHSNPDWARDELILALDVHFSHKPTTLSPKHPAILELSETLKRLPIHGNLSDLERFRNPNSARMKVWNFLRFDPSYKGKGLPRGAKAEGIIWAEYAGDKALLRRTANAIKAGLGAPAAGVDADRGSDEEEEFPEGRVLYRLHRARERSASLRDNAKAAALKKGKRLACVACDFEFADKYGDVGRGFIECHHTRPVSELADGAKTRLKDVALLRSNCHRMVHRRRPWLSMDDLRAVLVG